MKMTRAIPYLLFVVLGVAAGGSSLAQGHGRHAAARAHVGHVSRAGHGGIRIHLGFPVFGPWYYPGPRYYPYYYPPVVVVPASPAVYVEQADSAATPAPAQPDWFYCAEAGGYYPYVQQCPGGWQRVPSQPPR